MFDKILARAAAFLRRSVPRPSIARNASLTAELRRLEAGWAWNIASQRLGLIQDPGR
jgi:hypothetical protein